MTELEIRMAIFPEGGNYLYASPCNNGKDVSLITLAVEENQLVAREVGIDGHLMVHASAPLSDISDVKVLENGGIKITYTDNETFAVGC